MTQNEQIIKIARLDDRSRWAFTEHDFEQIGEDTIMGHYLAKLLQARMVADGWNITNLQWGIDKFCAWAKKSDDLKHSPDCDTESAALHALFCKVFSIEGEG